MNRRIEGHTVQRFDGEMNHLHLKVLEMGGFVLDQTEKALQALMTKDIKLARSVIERDHDVNAREIDTDEEIVTLIARRCPVAGDLRAIMSISNTVTDLERIGDEAVKIATIALNIYDNERSDPSAHLMRDVNTMGKLSIEMLRHALTVFDSFNGDEAMEVAMGRSELDAEFQSSVRRLATYILEDARNVGHAINIVLTIKAFERIGEYARNISEYVVYFVKGQDIRHQFKEINADI